jgi:hypothetical protein
MQPPPDNSNILVELQPGQQSDLQYEYEFETLITGEKGSGKAQPLDCLVATPYGFKPIGSLVIGSQVSNPDGSASKVIGVYPQGIKPVFRLTFSDGASTRATGEHLWLYTTVMRQYKGDNRYYPFDEEDKVKGRIATTDGLSDILKSNRDRSDKSMPNSIHIPSPRPLNFSPGGKKGWLREVDPYLLGVLLGDGCLRSKDTVSFSSADSEIIEEVARKILPLTMASKRNGSVDYRIRGSRPIIDSLKKLGVWGKLSDSKFVPDVYRVAPESVRMDLLRGLMDTDGTVDKDGSCSFTSTSLQLAQDVQWLVRSIGGVASISSKIPKFTYKGERKIGLKAYTVSLRTDKDSDMFFLSRKKERCRDLRGLPMMRTSRYLVSIEPDGEAECVCISVDNPNQLYITDDFIVTHNTTSSIIWIIRGNLDVPENERDAIDDCYINCPVFRAAVVRKNNDDLNDWIENAKRVYGEDGKTGLRATFRQNPREFTFPSGAKIILVHAADKDAYMRITGQSITRLFWDEITFEPDKDVYQKVYSSIRSTHKKMRAQILLACNPEGPGLTWVKERFIRFRDESGRIYKSGEQMRIPVYDPIRKKNVYVSRIYHHWKLDQNRIHLENDPMYAARLSSLDNPSLREAYLYGNWDAAGGKFFEFRRERRDYEPENACHVYDASKVVIQPWWPRLIGVDTGYAHYTAAFKIAMSPDGRVWVIDEMVHKTIGYGEWGAMLARWCVPDMAGLSQCGAQTIIPVFISPDAIEQRKNEYGTHAELILAGVNEVFGPNSAEILSPDDLTGENFEYNRSMQRGSYMPFRRATNKRVAGWGYMRELMRWDTIAQPDMQQYDPDHARRLVETLGSRAYFEYQDNFRPKEQFLPRLQISSRIRYLPDALESAASSENDLEDVAFSRSGRRDIAQIHDDVLDGARYGLVATKLYRQIKVPLDVRVDAALQTLPENQRHGAIEHVRNRMKKDEIKGFRIGRGANSGVYIS